MAVRIPAIAIFIASGALSVAVAAVAGVVMYVLMFDMVEGSVLREGLNQANAVGAAVAASYEAVEERRNELIRQFKMLHRSNNFSSTIDDNITDMNTFLLNEYFSTFLSPATYNSIQGAEIVTLFPRGITDNEEATGMSKVSVYGEVMRDGSRAFSVALTLDDGYSTDTRYINFDNTSEGELDYGTATIGESYFLDDNYNTSFHDYYVLDYATTDTFYFDHYVGPDGYPYFFANSYKYFYSLGDGGNGTTNPAGGYLAEVTVYQLVDTWYEVIREMMAEGGTDADTSIIVVDPVNEFILASSSTADREKALQCYASIDDFFADESRCAAPRFAESSDPLVSALIGEMVEPSWSELGAVVGSRSLKRDVLGTAYYVVAMQLGNTDSLRPFLIWARDADAVSRGMRRTLIAVVVVSSVIIALTTVLVALLTALMLLRPLKELQENMLLLTTLDTAGLAAVANLHERDEDELAAERQYEAARNDIATDDDDLLDDVADDASSASGRQHHEAAAAAPAKGGKSSSRGSSRSIISEISSLQKHFQQMAKAVLSFGKYVPQDVVRELMATGAVAESKMVEGRLTVLFSDIQGFTTLCEKLNNPTKVSRLLTLFFSSTTRRLLAHGATIDKFIGDCIMCFWGAPLRVDNPNFRALCAGLDLLQTARELDRAFQRHKVRLSIRVGAHCGKAMVGNIGSDERINYTVMGDIVNTASRLEGANKAYGSSFLASEEVLMGSKRSGMFAYRFVGCLTLRGKSRKTTAFHVCGTRYDHADISVFSNHKDEEVDSPKSADTGGMGASKTSHPTTGTGTGSGSGGLTGTGNATSNELGGLTKNLSCLELGTCYATICQTSYIRPKLTEICGAYGSVLLARDKAGELRPQASGIPSDSHAPRYHDSFSEKPDSPKSDTSPTAQSKDFVVVSEMRRDILSRLADFEIEARNDWIKNHSPDCDEIDKAVPFHHRTPRDEANDDLVISYPSAVRIFNEDSSRPSSSLEVEGSCRTKAIPNPNPLVSPRLSTVQEIKLVPHQLPLVMPVVLKCATYREAVLACNPSPMDANGNTIVNNTSNNNKNKRIYEDIKPSTINTSTNNTSVVEGSSEYESYSSGTKERGRRKGAKKIRKTIRARAAASTPTGGENGEVAVLEVDSPAGDEAVPSVSKRRLTKIEKSVPSYIDFRHIMSPIESETINALLKDLFSR